MDTSVVPRCMWLPYTLESNDYLAGISGSKLLTFRERLIN